MKELKLTFKKLKRWLDEENVEYEERVTVKPCLRLGIKISGIEADLFLAPYRDSVSIHSMLRLNENQTNVISKMDEQQKELLRFHIDKEIFNDPFLFYGHAAESHSGRGVDHIDLNPHVIYLDSLSKERLMRTLVMLWKSHRKYLFIVYEHTRVPID
jgi:hypothetical protein